MGKSSKARRSVSRLEQHDPRGIWDVKPQVPENFDDGYRKPSAGKSFHLQPKNELQQELIDAIISSEIAIAEAPAGCGKTYIVGSMAAKFLNEGKVKEIILTRANVLVGKTIGLLPGTVDDKMEPLLAPILKVLKERMGDGLYAYNRNKKKINLQPFEFVRGNSFKDAFIIIDEAQNLTKEEVKAIITRYESGRIVFIGDNFQNDLKGQQPGLQWLEDFAYRNNLDYPVIKFGLEHIVRSNLVKEFLTALYREENV